MSTATAVKATELISHIRSPFRNKPIKKWLRKDKQSLPIPHVDIVLRDIHAPRYAEHYHDTLKDDLMYMTYVHEHGPRPPPRQIRLRYDPEDPYTKNRVNKPVGGSQIGRQPAPPSTPDNIIRLEAIQLHTMVKEAVASRSNLLGAIAAFRAISAESAQGGGRHTSSGVQISRGKANIGGWVRKNIPIALTVTLKGPKMYDFIESFVEFVLPRLREFSGVPLPRPRTNVKTPSAVSGVVSFGLPRDCMNLFPQTEVNIEAYPGTYGMHVHFITNAKGLGAQNRARALISGFGVPFRRQ